MGVYIFPKVCDSFSLVINVSIIVRYYELLFICFSVLNEAR